MGAVSTPPEAPQRVIAGRYRLRRQLGQGSMGTVWEAYDEFLHRPVAVKEVRLPPGIPQAEADELRERTMREARAIAVLSHPNVITLHDVARERGEPFVVMEYLPAASLAQLLRRHGPLEQATAAAVADAVAAGLYAAHQAGITHRDVKPGNVLVAADGRVKLTDFGIARNVSERTMTRTGIMLGSPAYIAPEVASGREVTPAADLWGLGATLFAAVEGRAPYDPDAGVLETVSRVVNGEVPRPESTGPLSEIVTALMVKEPAERITLAEVRRRLHPLLPEPGTPLFSPADLGSADGGPAEQPVQDEAPTKVTVAPAAAPVTPAPVAPMPAAAPDGARLASDPGPLPFQPPPPPPRRRGVLARILVVLLALLLFLGAAAGGFALARIVGGVQLMPPQRTVATPQVAAPLSEFEVVTGTAATLAGAQGGGFSVPVPRDWTKFGEERVGTRLPNSTRVRFVSPDGTQELVIERFPGFYPKHRIKDYLGDLEARWPDGGYNEVSVIEITPRAGSEVDPPLQLTYRTSGATDLSRQTFANLLPNGNDLWVVGVTVPVEAEDTGRTTLFDRIAPEFTVTG